MTIPTTKRPQRRDGRQHKEECDREGLIGWRRRSASPFHFSALVLVLFLEPTLAAESSVGPGEYCERASQCTSFPILGDAACSSRCTVTARCKDSPLANHPPPFCCAGIPLGLPCSNHRERTCEESLECTPSKTNPQHYQCQDSRSSERNWKIGASLVIASAIMLNLGFNLQKFAYRALQVIPDDARPPAYKVPLWNIGFLVFLGGSLLNLVALKFAAQSLAAPLGGVSLISNAILAPFINNENLTRSDVVAILLILWGTVLVVIFSNHQDKTYTVCELFYLFQRFGTIVYITTLVILLVIVLSFIAKLDRTSRRLRGKLDRFGGITRSLRRAATGFIMSSKAFGARGINLVTG